MRTIYTSILYTGLLSLMPVMFLFWQYKQNLKQNSYNFQRRIIYNFDERIKLDIKYDSYYFAGYFDSSIYLGNRTATRHLLKIDSGLKNSEAIVINPYKDKLTSKGTYKIIIDTNRYYFSNGETRSSYLGILGNWNAKKDTSFIPFFNGFIPLRSSSRIYSYVSSRSHENSLLKISSDGKRTENDRIFEKQVDGLFCTSGTLGYNEDLNVITYVYKFRNEILVIDTNLQLLKKIRTIDPIDSAKFTVSTIESKKSRVITSPSLLVNARAFNWNKYLFVQSRLMGKKEDPIRFKHSFVIDIYDLDRSIYLYSLSIPNPDEVKINQLTLINNYLYVLSDHFIYRFKISLPGFEKTDRLLKVVKT